MEQQHWHIGVIIMGVGSLYLAIRYREQRISYFWLMMTALALRLIVATLTDLLNLWDEQYHAVVAKHMAENPLRPMLYPHHVLPFGIGNWTGNEIWLHKPPFFLWIMGLSIKIFGPHVWAVRLPSILLSAATCWLAADSARLMGHQRAGWWAALFLAFSYFPFLLLTGGYPTDHNDVFFIFLIGLSFWAWLRYRRAPTIQKAMLIGVIAGCAVLTKWLTGLWVFLPWGIELLMRRKLAGWGHLATAVGLTAVVVVPWYIHIFAAFPAEAAFEMEYNHRHFGEALEGHDEPWWYFLRQSLNHYRIGVLFVLIGFWKVFRRETGIMTGVFFVFVFFTIAATKMSAFTYMLVVPMSVALGMGWIMISDRLKLHTRKLLMFPLIAGLLWLQLNPLHLLHRQERHNEVRQNRWEWSRQFEAWNAEADRSNWVVFGLPQGSHALFLFYTDAIGYPQQWQQEVDHFKPEAGLIWADWNDGEPVIVNPAMEAGSNNQ